MGGQRRLVDGNQMCRRDLSRVEDPGRVKYLPLRLHPQGAMVHQRSGRGPPRPERLSVMKLLLALAPSLGVDHHDPILGEPGACPRRLGADPPARLDDAA